MKTYLLKNALGLLFILSTGCASYSEIDESEDEQSAAITDSASNGDKTFEELQDISKFRFELIDLYPQEKTIVLDPTEVSKRGLVGSIAGDAGAKKIRGNVYLTTLGYLNITVMLVNDDEQPAIHEKIEFFTRKFDDDLPLKVSFIHANPNNIFTDKNGEVSVLLRIDSVPANFDVRVRTLNDGTELILPFQVVDYEWLAQTLMQ